LFASDTLILTAFWCASPHSMTAADGAARFRAAAARIWVRRETKPVTEKTVVSSEPYMGWYLKTLHRSTIASSLIFTIAAGGACSKKEAQVDKKSPYRQLPEEKLKGVVRTNLDSPEPTEAQLDRKKRNITLVKAMGLPWIEHLPVVEDESKIEPRTKDEVAARCLATVFCAIKGESNDQKLVERLVERYSAATFFSAEEQTFFKNPKASKQDLANFAWRYECVHVFLWALGYLSELNPPHQIADVGKEVSIIRDKGPEKFTKDAKLRPMHEILDQADLYYRLHWAVIDLRLKGKQSDKANEEIIMERHRALNWLIRYMDQAWDDVTTDT
jgi:hypothetical protein